MLPLKETLNLLPSGEIYPFSLPKLCKVFFHLSNFPTIYVVVQIFVTIFYYKHFFNLHVLVLKGYVISMEIFVLQYLFIFSQNIPITNI